ncbi:MAG: hypothetical protein A2Z74_00095 [Chloroflexi bacterium RBG_13_46_9]|nr:MAG: hypothetical protein A2Z74_00095 [Chloroflexi bacterium RBG_13_46_9]
MKYVTAIFLFVLTIIGAVTMGFLIRDNPQYAVGEPTAIVKDWLQKQGVLSSSVPTDEAAENTEEESETFWTEEYIGNGKWLVSNAILPSGYSETELTFEEWISRTKGWSATRLQEYADDLSPEQREAYQEQLRTYTSEQSQYVDVLEQWYVYEKSGLIEKVQD